MPANVLKTPQHARETRDSTQKVSWYFLIGELTGVLFHLQLHLPSPDCARQNRWLRSIGDECVAARERDSKKVKLHHLMRSRLDSPDSVISSPSLGLAFLHTSLHLRIHNLSTDSIFSVPPGFCCYAIRNAMTFMHSNWIQQLLSIAHVSKAAWERQKVTNSFDFLLLSAARSSRDLFPFHEFTDVPFVPDVAQGCG